MLEIENKISVHRVVCRHGFDCELKMVTEIAEDHYKIKVTQPICPYCLANWQRAARNSLGQSVSDYGETDGRTT